MSGIHAVILGLITLGLFWFVAGVATKWHPLQLVMGEDGAYSTSKLQFFLWTAEVIFTYVNIFAFDAQANHFAQLTDFPVNLLLVMGISSATAVGAKAIAVSSANSAAPVPPVAVVAPPLDPADPAAPAVAAVAAPAPILGGILLDDNGSPDLSKIQLVMWTFIGIGIYLTCVTHALESGTRQLPDIDRTLMILMGLGHSAYLGKKIADAQS